MATVKINNKKYPIKPGLNATRIFCKKIGWELHNFDSNIKNLLPDGQEISFEQMEVIALLALSCIESGLRLENRGDEFDLEIDHIIDWFGSSPEAIQSFFDEFAGSLPTENDIRKNSRPPKVKK